MLRSAKLTFDITRNGEEAREAVLSYIDRLRSHGAIARHGLTMATVAPSTVQVVGVATAMDSIETGSHLSALRSSVEQLSASGVKLRATSYHDLLASEDEAYCTCTEICSLRLISDIIWGASPFRCPHGHLVAKYLIPASGEILNRVDLWDRSYEHVYYLWLLSATSDDWAESALCDPMSFLNQLGRSAAEELERQTSISVEVPLFSNSDKPPG